MRIRRRNVVPKKGLQEHAPRVLLVSPTANLVHRRILNGILRYAHEHGPWEFHMLTDIHGEQGIRRTKEWGCTGAIACIRTQARANAVIAAGVPVVFFALPKEFLVPKNPVSRFNRVLCDHVLIGRSAADYFLNRRFTNFAFVGDVSDMPWSRDRAKGFVSRLTEKGFACEVYPVPSQRERNDFGLEQRRLQAWLRNLPKPVALMAAWDRRGRQVLDTCMDAGISVPHEIAVLGVDNDEILCETTNPPLSSIAIGEENAGYTAAKILDGCMHSRKRRRACVVSYGMDRIVTRRSTETTRIADPLIAKALDFIRANIGTAARVSDVARYLNISRRMLELRARHALGGTIRNEILRLRLDRARSLLRNSRMTVSEIAAACGFSGPSHLGLRFNEAFHATPIAYRASLRRNVDSG